MQSEASLASSLQTLGLLTPEHASPLSSSTYASLTCTIAEELDPSFTPPPSSSPLEPRLEPLLRRLGYTADPTSRLSVLSFLSSTLRAHRILSLRRANSKPRPDPRDATLAAAVSRLQAALPHPHRSAPETSPHLASLLQSLVLAAANRVSALGGPDSAFGKPLLDPTAVSQQSDKCDATRTELVNEHEVRKRMLLHRLDVTVRAFARAERADPAKFQAMMEHVRRQAEEQGHVSTFEAVAAREWALSREHIEPDQVGNGVKNVVMGDVPDRGGRVGRGQGAEMPGFRARVPGSASGKGSYRKGKAGKRRRGRT